MISKWFERTSMNLAACQTHNCSIAVISSTFVLKNHTRKYIKEKSNLYGPAHKPKINYTLLFEHQRAKTSHTPIVSSWAELNAAFALKIAK